MIPKLKASNCIIILIGSIIQAVGIYNIHAISNVTEGGVLGLTLLLKQWFALSPALTSLVLNALCYALGWKTLGKSFIAYSALSIGTYSAAYAFLEQFPPLWPQIVDHPFIAAIAGAMFIGVGAGICVRAGGATAGDDALAMSLNHITGWPIERVYLISDLTVLTLSLSYIPMKRIAWSLLTVVLSGQIIGWIQKIDFRRGRVSRP
ncbi:MAG: YitT family protein [Oscillospiraceae bacterium]|nr:YitT family protein [Oscillospiraceae bacterium]